MTVSIGNVNFGVDAQTEGLRKSIAALQRFRTVVDQTARSQVDGAQKAAAALSKQESAIKRAFQQTLNLQRQLRAAGAPPEQLAATSNAFKRLTTELTSGRLSVTQFTRAMDAFDVRMGRVRRTLADTKAKKAADEVNSFQRAMRNLESSAVLAVGPLSGVGARIRSLGAIAGRSQVQVVLLLGAITALTVGLFKLAASAVNAERSWEKIEARFMASSDSVQEANRQMAFVVRTSRQLGLRIEDTAAAFSRLTAATAGTALEGEYTREIFLGIAKAAAALRLDTADVEGIFRAVEQMISKGQVTAEELRGQLGERLPGAFAKFAQSMGLVDTATASATKQLNDLLKAGDVGLEDILNFARTLDESFGGNAEENVNSFQGALNRLGNAAYEFSLAFNEIFHISDMVKGALNGIAAAVEFLTKHLRTLGILAGVVAGGLLAMAAPAIIAGIIGLARGIMAINRALQATIILSNAATGGLSAAVRKVGAVLAGAAAGAAVMNQVLDEIDVKIDDLGDTASGAFGPHLTDSLTSAISAIDEMWFSSDRMLAAMREIGTTIDDTFRIEGIIKAREMLATLNEDELVALQEHLHEIGGGIAFIGPSIEENLNDLFTVVGRTEDQWTKFVQSIQRTPEAMREFRTEMGLLQRNIAALNQGPRAMELFGRVNQQATAIERMRDRLEETNLSQEEQNRLLDEYIVLLHGVAQAEDDFSTLSADWAGAFTNSLEELIFKGGQLRDVIRSLGEELLQMAIRSAFLAPIEQGMSSFFGGLFGGKPSGKQFGGLAKGMTLVGEAGPEVVNLGSTSRVTPNHALGGVMQEIHLHFDVGLESVDTRIAQAAPLISKAARDGIMSTLYRPSHA